MAHWHMRWNRWQPMAPTRAFDRPAQTWSVPLVPSVPLLPGTPAHGARSHRARSAPPGGQRSSDAMPDLRHRDPVASTWGCHDPAKAGRPPGAPAPYHDPMSRRSTQVDTIRQTLHYAAVGVPLDEALEPEELRRFLDPRDVRQVVAAAGLLARKYDEEPPATWTVGRRRADALAEPIVAAMDQRDEAGAGITREEAAEAARLLARTDPYVTATPVGRDPAFGDVRVEVT